MKKKELKWESGPEPSNPDPRLKDQLDRAKQEADRQKETLKNSDGGSYQEKNGDNKSQYEDLSNQPKENNKPTHPQGD